MIKIIVIYLVVGNLLAFVVFAVEWFYHKRKPGLQETRSFVLDAMSGDPERFTPFKQTKEYDRLMKTTSVDSVYYFWRVVYGRYPGNISKLRH
jgi:hypothetical protein